MAEIQQGKDGAQYVRQQKGHSLILHILLCFVVIGFFTIPYCNPRFYSSPKESLSVTLSEGTV